jgi:hypothetical protein
MAASIGERLSRDRNITMPAVEKQQKNKKKAVFPANAGKIRNLGFRHIFCGFNSCG